MIYEDDPEFRTLNVRSGDGVVDVVVEVVVVVDDGKDVEQPEELQQHARFTVE